MRQQSSIVKQMLILLDAALRPAPEPMWRKAASAAFCRKRSALKLKGVQALLSCKAAQDCIDDLSALRNERESYSALIQYGITEGMILLDQPARSMK